MTPIFPDDFEEKEHPLTIGYKQIPKEIRENFMDPSWEHAKQWLFTTRDGSTISVIGGGPFYGDGVNSFEMMDAQGEIHEYITEQDINEHLKQNHSDD